MLMRAFLNFHFGEEHRRRHGRDRHLPALRATHAIKYTRLIAGCQNARQRCEWRANDVHSAHQFIGTPVGVYFVHNHRQHLKRLRQRPRRQRKPSLNIVEVQPVRLALLLHFINQLLRISGFGHCFCRVTIKFPLGRPVACARAGFAMAIRLVEIQGGFTLTTRALPQAFQVLPVIVYKVYADGVPR